MRGKRPWNLGFFSSRRRHTRCLSVWSSGVCCSDLRLPVEAGVAGLVFRTLRAQREFEVRELEALALRDPVLAGNLLGVANSALYGRAQRVSTVRRAIVSVGVIAARKVMLAAAMRPLSGSAGL